MNDKALRVLEYQKIIDMLVSECSSVLTKEQAKLLKPMHDAFDIREALADTDEAVVVLLKKGTPPFGNFYDISGFVHLAAKGGCLTMKQLLEIAYNLNAARRTASYLSSDLPELPRIDGLASAICVLQALEEDITRSIISEDEMSDNASPELKRIRRAIVKQNEEIKNKIQKIVGSSSAKTFLQEAIVTMRQGRYVVPVKAEHKSQIAGIVHDQSASGATLFIEPQAIVNMNNELRELELKEQQEIQRILEDFSRFVGKEEIRINANQQILTKLDFMFAKGRLACNMNAFKPEINDKGYVQLNKARHPLIDKKKAKPIDVAIGKGYRTLVITGPNTGGKTVTLKTVGLLCCMAQAGLFVPASGEGTTLPVFREIYADIGDGQSIEQSLSTFSSHMKNIVNIVESSTVDCLVLVDELGAGTDPTEGAALAISILNHLYNKNAKTIATTHYTELKKYALSTKGVQNASMEFDVETLSPTYRLIIGVPGKSNAFEISSKLGLADKIIDHARRFVEEGDANFEEVITSIEADRKKAENEAREAEAIRAELEKTKARMEKLEVRFKEQKEKLLEEAKDEARQIVEEARTAVADLQKEIREAIDNADVNAKIEESKRQLAEKKKAYQKKEKKIENNERPNPEDIKAGIRVNVLSVGEKGTVLSLPDTKGDMMVQAGTLKMKVNIENVTLVKENVTEKQREKVKYSRLTSAKSMSVQSSINVIGQTLDEATMNVDKYIDDVFLSGLETVTVIHGKGQGILKDGLRRALKKNKHVASIEVAGLSEGGEGATIVRMKK
ncbi:MAG: endonuclease MutS2 [Clostridia bacterium]|nr:endonuclease MutS2 [Clostridia bacterium]